GNIKIDGRNTPAGNRKNNLFLSCLGPKRWRRSAGKNNAQKNPEPGRNLMQSAKSRNLQLGDSPISFRTSRTRLKSKISSTETLFFNSTFKRVLSMTVSRVALETKRLRL